MAINGVGPTAGVVPNGQATGTGRSNGLAQGDFLQLLITQLRNQNPLEPVGGTEFLAQTAQFSTLEGINKLNTSIADLLFVQQLTQGAALIGKKVSYVKAGAAEPLSGVVSAVNIVNGKAHLTVGSDTIDLSQIRGIQAA